MPQRQRHQCMECGVPCKEKSGPSSIGCDTCAQWVHRRCVPITPDLFSKWMEADKTFTCRQCSFQDNSFDLRAALRRLRSDACATRAESEQLLLETYGIHMPPVKQALANDHAVDKISRQILARYHPVLLDTHKPLYVIGDGNCLFRAVSLSLFDTQDHYRLLRLLTGIEMLVNQQYYDSTHPQHTDLFNDSRLVFDSYEFALEKVLEDGGYCCLLAMSALSAALCTPIQSYCPPTQGAFFLTEPLSRAIRGRGVSNKKSPESTIMWTTSFIPKKVSDFRPNHFVPLIDHRQPDMLNLTLTEDILPQATLVSADARVCEIGMRNDSNDTGAIDRNDEAEKDVTSVDDVDDDDVDDSNEIKNVDDDDVGDEVEDIHVSEEVEDVEDDDVGDEVEDVEDDDVGDEVEDVEDDDVGEEVEDVEDDDVGDEVKDVEDDDVGEEVEDVEDDDDVGDEVEDVHVSDEVEDVEDDDDDVGDEVEDVEDDDVGDEVEDVEDDDVGDEVKDVEDDDDVGDEVEDVEDDDACYEVENVEDDNVKGQQLPNGKFLELDYLLKILRNKSATCLKEIPVGAKNNVFFVVDNEENTKRRMEGKSSQHWDDRGAWNPKGATNKTFLFESLDGGTQTIYMRDKMYCSKKQKNNKTVYELLHPQPSPSAISILHRYYTKHSCSRHYGKRVSWLDVTDGPHIAVYEYKGKGPHTRPHGLATSDLCSNYVRTKPHIMTQIKDDLKSKTPAKVYREGDDFFGPRNKKQVYNIKAAITKKQNPISRANFADQVVGVEELQHKSSFVRLIIRQSQKAPCIILYSDEQISDVKRCCCPPFSAESTVLGVDKTFNLSDLHVTTTVFKNISVVKRDSGDHPVFLGPIFLHGNSDSETFFLFFHHLAGVLCQEPSPPTLGSDEEAAMVRAMEKAFQQSYRFSCSRHLRNNLIAFLTDKVGLSKKERNTIVTSVFAMVDKADDHTELHDRLQLYTENLPSQVSTYVRRKIMPHLLSNMQASACRGLRNVSRLWTNNNSESLNHCLKQATQWKALKLVELILKLEDLVLAQYRELRRALVDLGEFKLDKTFISNQVARENWFAMDSKKKERLFKKFLSAPREPSGLVRSSQSRLVLQPAHGGKKPGQRRRKRSEKTTSRSKQPKLG